ncbi:Nop domain-containing protein [Artemisia annua]|uniref:Nop domain-containing protein n=1 Tax=Artemisia annua TaxID=35608 RepID=A0A2U1PX73_ARTAN|nr:Nop domain-containing protein [Artemisia annua]
MHVWLKKIGNEVDLTLVDLEGILPSDTINIMALSFSPTSLRLLLPEDVLEKTIEACDRAILLDASKKKVLTYVEYRMRYIKAMRKLAKKFRFQAPGPGGEGHRQLAQVSERKLPLTVARIKQIAVIDRTFKIDYKYPSGESTTGLTSSLTFKPAQVDPQAEDARRLSSQIQAIYISES